MHFLNKIIQLREKDTSAGAEKPFLEHLEDLRVMIMRIVITLAISMVVCFIFQKQLMAILRKPVDQIAVTRLEETLPMKPKSAPRPLTAELWEKAKSLEQAASKLEPEEREALYRSSASEELVFHAKSIRLLRAVLTLPEEKREGFLESLKITPELKLQVKELIKTGPDLGTGSGKGDLKYMSALGPTETFLLSMKLAFFSGVILAFPLLLWFILQFVLPGLHAHEKRVIWPAISLGFGLFLSGVLFAYFLILPRTLVFFFEWGGDLGISNDWRIGEYISFASQFTLLFGIAFELPVVVMVLVKLGILTYEIMAKTRRYAIIAIFVIAAVLTPTPDWITQTCMAVPMLLLYEISIWLAWFERKKNRVKQEQEAWAEEDQRIRSGYYDASLPSEENSTQHESGAIEVVSEISDLPHKDQQDESGDDGWNPDSEHSAFPSTEDLPEVSQKAKDGPASGPKDADS